ncbi:PP2C family protein-serine/threonine phosphatase [Streptomyces sp. AN091965]|uniref:PP2C family protein-serine/threonine phosphatase n=1 Tax=Streptomyces sp. AN091965 TaxID=2927803 RepID=UPI001F60E808|nr:PP2C family protein-serine/threonine phosphatase [Streptomyces sp. AN091965]MCI3934570.1 serine/threonine-protein phosphatase [Streptomyces sp. AN091965]
MTVTDLRSLPALRHAVRSLADTHGLGVEVRARLALAVTRVAAPFVAADHPVTLAATREDGVEDGAPLLVVTLGHRACRVDVGDDELPLTAHSTTPSTVTWHIALDTAGVTPEPRAADELPHGETEVLLKELGAALAQVDALKAEHRLLKHELAETNSGVLALYVQLDERDQQVRRAHGRVLRELEDALRPPVLDVPGLELGVHYAPADSEAPTGGDLYDWFVLPDGTVHITVVDALGHGVRSTRTALNVTHAVRTLALEGHPLDSIVVRTNEVLAPFDPALMATVLLARLRPETGELHLAGGSHPPALLMRQGGGTEYLETPGRGIGFPLPGSEKVRRTRMRPGDLLLLYTDGLTESRRDPEEGEARLARAVRDHAHRPTAHLPRALAKEMHAVILHADDTLALAVRLGAGPTGPRE